MSKIPYLRVLVVAVMACSSAWAQQTDTATPTDAAQQPSRVILIQDSPQDDSKTPEARTERIRIEGSQVQIDELRVRGETQSIEVKPQEGFPAYEVVPESGSQSPGRNNSGGQRMWRVLSF